MTATTALGTMFGSGDLILSWPAPMPRPFAPVRPGWRSSARMAARRTLRSGSTVPAVQRRFARLRQPIRRTWRT